jgi:toxin-antitoxin system, antitoxin component, PHD family
MSEEEYNNLMENLYIMSNKKYYNELLKRKEEVEAGNVQIHDIIEVE